MILAYVAFFASGIIVFFLMRKFALSLRIAIALAVFLIPSAVLTLWIVRVGDKPPPDAVTIVPKPVQRPRRRDRTVPGQPNRRTDTSTARGDIVGI